MEVVGERRKGWPSRQVRVVGVETPKIRPREGAETGRGLQREEILEKREGRGVKGQFWGGG